MPQDNNNFQQNNINANSHRPNTSGGSPFAPGDPFADGAPNPFDSLASRGNGSNTGGNNMPNGMNQVPPENSSMYRGNQYHQEAEQLQAEGGSPSSEGGNQGGSPLDKWHKKPDNKGEPAGKPDGDNSEGNDSENSDDPFGYGRDDYHRLVANANLAGEISEESVQKILSGDAQELSRVINEAARNAVSTASLISARVSRAGVQQNLQNFQQRDLQQILRDSQFKNEFETNKHEILSHPAVSPLVEQKAAELRNSFPNANPREIREKLEEYFQDLANVMSNAGKQPTQQQQMEQRQSSNLSELFDF